MGSVAKYGDWEPAVLPSKEELQSCARERCMCGRITLPTEILSPITSKPVRLLDPDR